MPCAALAHINQVYLSGDLSIDLTLRPKVIIDYLGTHVLLHRRTFFHLGAKRLYKISGLQR